MIAKRLKRRLLTVSSAEPCLRGSPAAREHVERIAATVLDGYHAALDDDGLTPLVGRLDAFAPEERGYAYEGAAMALTLLDALSLWRKDRLSRFLAGPAGPYIHMAYVGIGWGLARLPFSTERRLRGLHPILRWLAVDGYGFHEGLFRAPAAIDRQSVPSRFRGYARRAFDQGLGRSLWFVEGTAVEAIVRTIDRFPPARRPDLWSGVGLACCYAGGAERDAIVFLARATDGYHPQFAQGVAFAAKARVLGGTEPAHTRMACEVATGRTVADLADLTDRVRTESPDEDGELPSFEAWRRSIQNALARSPEP